MKNYSKRDSVTCLKNVQVYDVGCVFFDELLMVFKSIENYDFKENNNQTIKKFKTIKSNNTHSKS